MSLKNVIKLYAGLILLVQIILLIYSSLSFKNEAEVHEYMVFIRISLLIGSAMMVIITRYFLKFFAGSAKRNSQYFMGFLSLFPALLIPVGGFIFARNLNSNSDYLLFFIIGLYHLVRYYPMVVKNVGA